MRHASLAPILLITAVCSLLLAGCSDHDGATSAKNNKAATSANTKEADAKALRNRDPGAIRVFQEVQKITNIKQWDALGMPPESRPLVQQQLAECGGNGEVDIKRIRNFDLAAGGIGCKGDNSGQPAVFFRSTSGKWRLFTAQVAPTCAQLHELGVPFPIPEGFVINQCVENGEFISPK